MRVSIFVNLSIYLIERGNEKFDDDVCWSYRVKIKKERRFYTGRLNFRIYKFLLFCIEKFDASIRPLWFFVISDFLDKLIDYSRLKFTVFRMLNRSKWNIFMIVKFLSNYIYTRQFLNNPSLRVLVSRTKFDRSYRERNDRRNRV